MRGRLNEFHTELRRVIGYGERSRAHYLSTMRDTELRAALRWVMEPFEVAEAMLCRERNPELFEQRVGRLAEPRRWGNWMTRTWAETLPLSRDPQVREAQLVRHTLVNPWQAFVSRAFGTTR